ncbi:MAG: PEP-CTERM sorting domain-containing protein [Planctomycetaceae bacterium]|uniref:PEP-CTERM protein-sorting domain-containing protein n=1 Tax=Lacipirellula limnantheis TaxID=2528024 RepID=A0A517U4G9_9BACT|nr:sugar-binding protein [Lacipirellula limnantheis]MBL9162161.1 PEP-CTERM sorting domain-containing protein [Planctomycetaceae bacterium]QDT75522.1 hypothetical protein I41_47330 [Lacipirellula limnantheis]
MSHHGSFLSRALAAHGALAAMAIVGAGASPAVAQTVRNYNVNQTNVAPTIDGVVSPGEWNNAATASGSWGVLREAEGELDTENNRFRMMWDANNLYVLYETNFNIYSDPADKVGDPNPGISFGADNLNLYLDPNTDGGPNFVDNPEDNVDGYQFAFNQFSDPDNGSLTSTDANRQGVGFFTEAHANTPFGDQANWNRGGSQVAGAAMQNIVVSQRNTATGGVAEIVFPFANFNADAVLPGTTDAADFDSDGLVNGSDFLIWQRGKGLTGQTDKTTGDANLDGNVDAADLDQWKTAYGTNTQYITGLNATSGVDAGDQWFFNMSRINGQGDQGNFLPIWNWTSSQSFALRPHGTITFLGAPTVGAVPEPASLALAASALAGIGLLRRRRAG